MADVAVQVVPVDPVVQRRPQRRGIQQAGQADAKWAELDSGHYPMLSMPTELTSLLPAG